MGGLMHRPPLCQILLLILAVVAMSFVGQVSGRARIIRSVPEDITETPDEHTTTTTTTTTTEQPSTTTEAAPTTTEAAPTPTEEDESNTGTRERREAGGPTSQFLCPDEYQGVTYECIDQRSCQPNDVWNGAACVGGYHLACCRKSLAAATGAIAGDSSGNFQREHVDYYNLPRNMLTQLLTPAALEAMDNFSPTQKCGVRSPIKTQQCLHRGRIASANEDAESCFAEWPWHVAVLEKQRHKCSKATLSDYDRWRLRCHIIHPVDLYRYICGGILISPNHVLTAAHCVKGVRQDRLKLHLGDYNLYSSSRELLPEIQRSVLNADIHEGYDPYTYEDDLAILTLDKAVDLRLTPHISPVCLPSVDHEFTESTHCSIVGWGEDPYKPNHGSNILKSVDVTIGTEEECEDKLGQSFTLGRHQLCVVGNLGTDACLGDGGGAVVCPVKSDADFGRHYRGSSNSPDKYVSVGIISWGSESCGENSVTVMNMILPYIGWIGLKTSPRRQPQGYYGYQQQTGQGGSASPCEQNPFLKKVQTGGYVAIAGLRMLLQDIVCVFGETYTNNPNYKLWYDSVFGPGAGVITSPTTDGSCNENKFFKKVRDNGYPVVAKTHLSLEDIKCVFGEDFAKNPNYKVWFDSIHGATTSPGVVPSGGQGCGQNHFLQKVATGGYGAISGISLTLDDIKCVFGEDFSTNPNYNVWFASVHGSGTSPGVTGTGCEQNPSLQKVATGGYGEVVGLSLTLEDIICVFGEDFAQNPNYKVWFDSVHGTSTSPGVTGTGCEQNPFLQKVATGGYGAISGMSLILEDITCVFGEDFASNPNYKVWFDSVHGSGTSPGATGQGCELNPFLQKVKAGGYGAISGMALTIQDIRCVFGEEFESNPNYKVWFDSVHGTGIDSCKENHLLKKVDEHGYSAITGTIMTMDDIKCVFGEDFTNNPNYNPWFVSVFCVAGSALKQYPDTCCELRNFKAEVCCGAGKHNPPGLCGSLPGY